MRELVSIEFLFFAKLLISSKIEKGETWKRKTKH